jgi:uncharacterized membrane protein
LRSLRDEEIWPHINRKSVVTVYPPAAQMLFAALWRIWPDSVKWFQIAMAASALLAGGLLVSLLRAFALPTTRVLIYLWSPLLLFETAHAAHVDALVLPLLVGAWWARVKERAVLVGVLLGLATAIKLYPVMLLPALWQPPKHAQNQRGWWQMPLAFGVTVALCYLPYWLTNGAEVLGFLSGYVGERFNMGLAGIIGPLLPRLGLDPNTGILLLTIVVLGALALYMLLKPSQDGRQAVARCIWLMGAFTLLTQNLFSWYMLWMLPLLALFMQPARPEIAAGLRRFACPALDAWSGWWLFCGLIALSYSFFITWRPVPIAIWSQFLPLYLMLLWSLGQRLRATRQPSARVAFGHNK